MVDAICGLKSTPLRKSAKSKRAGFEFWRLRAQQGCCPGISEHSWDLLRHGTKEINIKKAEIKVGHAQLDLPGLRTELKGAN